MQVEFRVKKHRGGLVSGFPFRTKSRSAAEGKPPRLKVFNGVKNRQKKALLKARTCGAFISSCPCVVSPW